MKLLYKFGSFTIDKHNKLLLKDERPVQLKPKVFDTLLVLVEGKGNVLTKDDLMEKIWAETAVEENNLQQNISILRKILGDTEEGEQYIETIPRRGYRFAATVEEIADDEALIVERRTRSKITIDTKPATLTTEKPVNALAGEPVIAIREQAYTDAVTTTTSEAVTQTQVKRRAVAAGMVIGVMLMGAAAWRFTPQLFKTPRGNRNFVLKQSQVLGMKTDGENLGVIDGKLSPDGKTVAYTVEGVSNTQNISVKVIDNDHATAITKEPNNNWCPIWSADGSEIAFLSDRDGEVGLWRVHHFGGAAKLVHHFIPYAPSAAVAKPRLTLWSEDGKTIYYEWRNNFFALDIDTKEVRQLTDFDPTQSRAQDFCFSPNQEWIAYTDRKENQTDLWKISAKGGAPVRLTNDAIVEDTPVWSADGESLIYTSSQEGSHELRLFDFESKESIALLSGLEAGQIYDVSRDRSKILYRIRKDEADLWKVMVGSGEDTQITSDLGVEFWADVSPDGANVVFQTVKSSILQLEAGRSGLVTKSLSPNSQVTPIASSASQAQWSPDAKTLAFLQIDKGVLNLHIINVIGGKSVQLSEGGVSMSAFDTLTYNHINDYSWSPDSSKLAYISRKDGARNLAVTSIDGSGEVKLSNNKDEKLWLANPFWSPDGKRIAYVTDDYQNPENGKRTFRIYSVWIANLENPENPELIFQSESYIKLAGWSGDNELIVGLVDKKEKSIVKTLDVDLYLLTNKSSQKLTTLKQAYFLNLHLSPDKKTIAFVAIQDKKSNIYTYALKGGETKQITRNTDATIFFSSLDWSPDGAFICYGKQERLNSFTIIDGLK
jgi:Tol biopolymer transport system component/DNA-binding winged helix-turn-helix (wHTH) protein